MAIFNSNKTTPLPYQSHGGKFSNPLDCILAHMIYESAEVLSGTKPANLISITNRQQPCGRNLFLLWQTYQHEFENHFASMRIILLKKTCTSVLLFCHDPQSLEVHLAHPGIRQLLCNTGYSPASSCSDMLDVLKHRIQTCGTFPHEIGLFLGYPAKDVAAFMGIIKIPFTRQGPWRIYGNPAPSLALAYRHRTARNTIATILSQCSSPLECLSSCKPAFF